MNINQFVFVLIYSYVCLVGSSTPTPTDGIQGYRCTPGYYCPRGATVPLGCDIGTYNSDYGQSNCTVCPEGMMCPDINMTAPLPCMKGKLIII